jgi:hypothetical protein
VVFNSRGEREAALSAAAADMLTPFEALLARLAAEEPPAASMAGPKGARSSGGGEEGEEGGGGLAGAPLAAMLQARPSSRVVGRALASLRLLVAAWPVGHQTSLLIL